MPGLCSRRAELYGQGLHVARSTEPSCLYLDTCLKSLPFLEDVRPWEHGSFALVAGCDGPSSGSAQASGSGLRWAFRGDRGHSLLDYRAWSPGMGRSVTCTLASHRRVGNSPGSQVAAGPALKGGRMGESDE